MILNDQTILLGVGAALAPLTLALLLWAVTSMRKATARRKAQRAAERVQREEARAIAAAQIAAQQAEQQKQFVPAAAASAASAADPEAPKRAEGKDRSKLSFGTAEAKPEEDHQENNEDGVSADMRDLLSSVFDDDSSNSPYAALLENLSTVNTSDLVNFAGQISSLLNTQAPAAADEEH
jgi:type II secretory pathway pseudopilin PulG